jgi:hypothetical protein
VRASRRKARSTPSDDARKLLVERGYDVGPKPGGLSVGSKFFLYCGTCGSETTWQIHTTVDTDTVRAVCQHPGAKTFRVAHPGKPDAGIVRAARKVPRRVQHREVIQILSDSERHQLAMEFSNIDPARFVRAHEAKGGAYIKDDILGSGRVVALNAQGLKGMFWTGIWLLPT